MTGVALAIVLALAPVLSPAASPERPTTTASLGWHRARIAPWYGPGFYGKRTACGKRMSRTLRGAAHRTLPCGTKIKLRWRGHKTTVRVVDRGPYPARSLYGAMPLDLTARTNCWDLNGGRYQSPCPSRRNLWWKVVR